MEVKRLCPFFSLSLSLFRQSVDLRSTEANIKQTKPFSESLRENIAPRLFKSSSSFTMARDR